MQHGVVTRQQLAECGMSRSVIRDRLKAGQLDRVAASTFVVVGSADSDWQLYSAAVLSRSKAFLSGRTAAFLHALDGFAKPTKPEITVPASTSGRNAVAVVRRSQHYDTISTVDIERLAVADPVETVFRVAQYVSPRRLTGLLDSLLIDIPGCVEQLADVYLRHQGERMKGMAALRPLLLERTGTSYVPDESQLEALADAVFSDLDLPGVVKQAPLPWAPSSGRVDRLIPAWRLIVELDGRRWHARSASFESDRQRDNAATANGYSVLRFTWSMLRRDPARCRQLVLAVGHRQSQLSA